MQYFLVSIIIPIYKVEPYIVRCINSVLHQTYRNLEVILVDDCSPDRSMEIAREHIESSPLSHDLRFVYQRHEHNRGLSAARNTGIDVATGDCIFFLDSDDEITENCISILIEPMVKNGYDCVIGNIIVEGTKDSFFQLRDQKLYYGTEAIAKAYLCGEWYPMAWNKLYSSSLLKEHSLYFKEGLIHEDELWNFMMIWTAQTICTVKRPTYIYYIRPNSITTANTINKRIENYLKVLKGMYEFQEEKHLLFKEVDRIEMQFLKSIFQLLQNGHNTLLSIYMIFRNSDVRSFATKRGIYNNPRAFIMNFDLFLPSHLGFCYKYLLWKVKKSIRGRPVQFY